MELVNVTIEEGGSAVVAMSHGKVNALDESTVDELIKVMATLEKDPNVRVVVLTGRDKFFSFGFDIPQFMDYSVEDFTHFLKKFTELYRTIFMFPKPVIAAINGHCIASGAMLATACDYRIMVAGRTKIGINELGFGSTVFAGTVEMLKYVVGSRNACKILYSADLFSAGDALTLGFVDKVTTSIDMPRELGEVTRNFASKDMRAFASLKRLLRQNVHQHMLKYEAESITEFVKIWYSDETRAQLADIKIHD